MQSKISLHIIEKNILGSASAEEQSRLYEWLESDENNRESYFRMKNIYDSSRMQGYTTEEIRNEWELLLKRINSTIENKKRPSRSFSIWKNYVAIIIAVLALSWTAITLRQSEKTVIYQQFTVPNGQQTEVILADGSKVWINAGSTLKYPSDFGIKNREVILDGEAGFQVTPSKIPFIVETNDINIKVLGTYFNIRNYASNDFIEISLLKGSIQMHTPQQEFTMKPGEIATYHKQQQTANVKKDANIADKIAWSNKQLIINNERFEEIAHILERWYNIQIVLANDELKEYRYTGKFIYNEKIEQVLEVFRATTPIHYQIEGNKITISKQK